MCEPGVVVGVDIGQVHLRNDRKTRLCQSGKKKKKFLMTQKDPDGIFSNQVGGAV